MAYYGRGKYKFDDLIESTKDECAKAFLKYKKGCHYENDEKKAYIEQWLYNEDCGEVRGELRGFIAGFLFNDLPYFDHEKVMIGREVLPKLAKIYIKMNKDNKWDEDGNLNDWKDALAAYGDKNEKT